MSALGSSVSDPACRGRSASGAGVLSPTHSPSGRTVSKRSRIMEAARCRFLDDGYVHDVFVNLVEDERGRGIVEAS